MHQKSMSRNASLKCLVDNDAKKQQAQPHPNQSDDQPIQQRQMKHNYNFQDGLIFKIQVQRAIIEMKKNETQCMTGMITVSPQEQLELVKQEQAGVDLVCVIDKSGSMQGEKMDAVKLTLNKLLDFLTEKDRLCLIEFDLHGTRLCPFLVIDEVNKITFRALIKKITACGETSIFSGMKIAVNELENRKHLNNVAAVFLLSDGQDPYGKRKVGELLLAQSKYIYTIHSFGYGQDHDPDMMTSICQMKKGSFYFIDNVNILDEYFISALAGLQTVIAEEIKLEIEALYLPHPFDTSLSITKTFGDQWSEIIPQSKYSVEIFHLAQGLQKNFVFQFEIPKGTFKIDDPSRRQICFKSLLTLKNTSSEDVIQKEAVMALLFYNEEEPLPAIQDDDEVTAEMFRVNAAKIIDDAMKACMLQKYEEGQQKIQILLNQISSSNKNVLKLSEKTVFQLKQSYNACSKKSFQTYGYSQMHSIRMISINQFGLNSQFDGNGKQSVKYDQSNSNQAQIQMGSKILQQKQEELSQDK